MASMACRLEEEEETTRRHWQARRGGVLVHTKVEETLHAGREAGRGEGRTRIAVQAGMLNESPHNALRMEPSTRKNGPTDPFSVHSGNVPGNMQSVGAAAMFNGFWCN